MMVFVGRVVNNSPRAPHLKMGGDEGELFATRVLTLTYQSFY